MEASKKAHNRLSHFDLPRELRDQIYDELGDVKPYEKCVNLYCSSVSPDVGLSSALLCVNKQFAAEYVDRPMFKRAVALMLPDDLRPTRVEFKRGEVHPAGQSLLQRTTTVCLALVDDLLQTCGEDAICSTIDDLCSFMPHLKELAVEYRAYIDVFERDILSDNFDTSVFFAASGVTDVGHGRTVTTRRSILLNAWLCDGVRSADRTEDFRMDGAGWLRPYRPNHIKYVGTRSTGQYAWHGLDLKITDTSAQLDVEQALTDLRATGSDLIQV